MDVYIEGNARYTATGGMSYMTFTPLQGMSDVVLRFLHESDERRAYLTMGYKDALHMTPEMLADAMAKYPTHEHDARMNGAPLLGSGRIFIDNEATFTFKTGFPIPDHWPKLWGVDFGIDHPFAAALTAWDRDLDIIYVTHCYRAANALPLVHSEALRAICPDAPVAWPHDGNAREENKLGELMPLYKKFDLRMLPKHAQYEAGGYSTEAVIMELQQRFQRAGGPGGIRVREDLGDFFEEYRMYHRKDGLIVKKRDDLLSALMKAVMMRRYARVVTMGYAPRPSHVRPKRPALGRINPWTGRPDLLT